MDAWPKRVNPWCTRVFWENINIHWHFISFISSLKHLMGVCHPGFHNHTLGYGDWGPKSYPWLQKMGQNQTLDIRKYHLINHFWSNFAWNWSNLAKILSFSLKKMLELGQNGQNLLKKNLPLPTEPQPKLDPWLRKSSQKQTLGYGNWVQKGTLAGSTPPVRST